MSKIFKFIKMLSGKSARLGPPDVSKAKIIPREQHCVSRADISKHTLDVLTKLNHADFNAYLVGGGVRDLLLRLRPKDFDVATDAHPEQIKKLFRNCRLIGRRFRLAHIFFRRHIIEVATFRTMPIEVNEESHTEHGMIKRDNIYGNMIDDAFRRDFTINALYYDIKDFSIIDFTGGFDDIKSKTIRLIGEPSTRYREDPVRILRAARFAAKLDFEIHPDTLTPISGHLDLLDHVSPSRLFEEVVKFFQSGYALKSFEKCQELKLFSKLFTLTQDALDSGQPEYFDQFIKLALSNTDKRIAQNKPITPAFIFAALLWGPVQLEAKINCDSGEPPYIAFDHAIRDTLQKQHQQTRIPKRFTLMMREMWRMQSSLTKRAGKRPFMLLQNRRFRAAYDFLLLRCEVGELDPELGHWWTRFQKVSDKERHDMIRKLRR